MSKENPEAKSGAEDTDAVAGHEPVVPPVKNPWSRKPQDQIGDQDQVKANSDVNVVVRDGEKGVSDKLAENHGAGPSFEEFLGRTFGKLDLGDGINTVADWSVVGGAILGVVMLFSKLHLRGGIAR